MYAIRDLTSLDYERCEELIQDPLYQRLFVTTNLSQLHLQCSYAAVAIQNNEVEAVLLVGSQPQFYTDLEPKYQPGSVPGSRCQPLYTDYIKQNYEIDVPLFTSKFARLAACTPGNAQGLAALIRSYFLFDPKNEYLLLNSFPYCSLPDALRAAFPEIDGAIPLPSTNCVVRLCQRSDILKPLEVRMADMKDHDDLVDIFQQQNTNLKERFGDFYLASLIEKCKQDPSQTLALVGSDFETNSEEIRKPVCFIYAERFNSFNSDTDSQIYSNLLITHQLEKYGIDQVATDRLAFVRATACYAQAESRSADVINYLFQNWKDCELLILSLPSSSTCTQMQLLRLFTLVEPRNCLSPKESLFVCHRDAWIAGIKIQQLQDAGKIQQMQNYLNLQLQTNQQNKNILDSLEVLQPGCKNGTLAAYIEQEDGRKIQVALLAVDLTVGERNDAEIFKEYIALYEKEIFQKGAGRIIKSKLLNDNSLTKPQNSIYSPPSCLQCKTWCKMHYDTQLNNYGYLKAFVVDPLYLQFKDDLLDYFMDACGVDGFLLQIGYQMQQFVKPCYDVSQDKFLNTDVDPQNILTGFEKELFRQADFIDNVNILPNPHKTYYDGQLGANYGTTAKQPDEHPSYQNSMYDASSKLHADRKRDEQLFNEKQLSDELQDLVLSAIRSLTPEFALFVLHRTSCIKIFTPPVKLANQQKDQLIIKPASLMTDRLVVVGSGAGLLAALQSLQDCHKLARYKSVTVVHPPPGMVYPFSFAPEFRASVYDHGETLPVFRKRASALFFDQYVGDIYEINMQQGYLKVASGAEIQFDQLLICPDGADSESLRQIPSYNLNSAVAFNYGNTDPCGLENNSALAINKNQLSTFNKRGFNEEEIMNIVSDQKQHVRLLSSLYNEQIINVQKRYLQQKQEQAKIQIQTRFMAHNSTQLDIYQIVKQRLHARTFFRFLSRDAPIQRRQLAAVNCATTLQNLTFCIQQLYSPNILKQMLQHQKQLQQLNKKEKDKEKENEGDETKQGDADIQTHQNQGYKVLSPGAKISQILQIMNPQVQAELPLIIDKMSQIIDEARRQNFPDLYPKLPPRADEQIKAPKTCTAVDVARTTVCVFGDTFEAFAVVQAFLDKGVYPDSIVLLLPQDPNADIDPIDEAQNDEIDYLVKNQGYGQFRHKNGVQPTTQIQALMDVQQQQSDTQHIESKFTTQQAEKRSESFPAELHKAVVQKFKQQHVHVIENVKILDVYASYSTSKTQRENDDNAENNSEQNDEEDDEFEDVQEDDEIDDEFDETKEITELQIIESLETLQQLDELDVCLHRKQGYQQFAFDIDQLNEICDQILLKNENAIIKNAIGKDDENFNVDDLTAEEKEAELNRMLKLSITKLARRAYKILLQKKPNKKKMLNGAAFCGVRLQLLKTEDEESRDVNQAIPTQHGIGRTFQTKDGHQKCNLYTQDLNQGTTTPGQIDVQCCALFLTEPFGVPNNISSAIMRSDLVFDKALILNGYGQSSDERVYASGNIAKINRSTLLQKLKDQQLNNFELHYSPMVFTQDPVRPVVTWSLYSQQETAAYSAYQLVRNRLVNTEPGGLVPEFARPLVLNARLGGGYVFRVSRPLRDLRDQRLIGMKLFRTIKTGDIALADAHRFCLVEIDPLGIIDSFVIYSSLELEDMYKQLVFDCVGMPICLFNQLEQRWQREEVDDILDYLCGYQIQALFSKNVIQQVNDLVFDILAANGFQSDVQQLLDNVPQSARSIADVGNALFNPEIGYQTLKNSQIQEKIFVKLVDLGKKIAEQVEERFFEINRGVGIRGKVAFQ